MSKTMILHHTNTIKTHSSNYTKSTRSSCPTRWTSSRPGPLPHLFYQRHLAAKNLNKQNSTLSANARARAKKLRNHYNTKLKLSKHARKEFVNKTDQNNHISGYTLTQITRVKFSKVSKTEDKGKSDPKSTNQTGILGHESVQVSPQANNSVRYTRNNPFRKTDQKRVKNSIKDIIPGATLTPGNQKEALEEEKSKDKNRITKTIRENNTVSFGNTNPIKINSTYRVNTETNLGPDMSDKKWELELSGEVPQEIFEAPGTQNCPQETKIIETEGPLDLSVNKSQDSDAKNLPLEQEKIDESGQTLNKEEEVKFKCLPKYGCDFSTTSDEAYMEHFQTVHQEQCPNAEPLDAVLAQNPDSRPQPVTPSCEVVVKEQKSRKNLPTKGTGLDWSPTIYDRGTGDANDKDVDDICRSIEVTGIEDPPNPKPTTSEEKRSSGGDAFGKTVKDPDPIEPESKSPETTTLKMDKKAPNPPPGLKNPTRKQKSDAKKSANEKKSKKIKTGYKTSPIPTGSKVMPKWGNKPPTKAEIKSYPEPKNSPADTTRDTPVVVSNSKPLVGKGTQRRKNHRKQKLKTSHKKARKMC